ncbi:DUF1819 family protein [Flammeovirgaceae bacterium SG7u.111]|nr:DUF1819 family protein [Flammeovirgaceae bacterium SG7u.132]WPO34623.1 DUF1819 family protein [Flammeovirgaceae bacterium SG7u.111]
MTTEYNFSFTGFSLKVKEMSKIAYKIEQGEEIDYTNELGHGKKTTGQRAFSEIAKRLNVLTERQKELLINGDLVSQKQIALLSVCKCHFFLRDFVVEVLREKQLVFDYQLTFGEFASFIRRKSEVHANLEEKSDSSIYKIRKVTFQILEESGLIDNNRDKTIQPQILAPEVVNAICQDDPNWLKLFFVSDIDIQKLTD